MQGELNHFWAGWAGISTQNNEVWAQWKTLFKTIGGDQLALTILGDFETNRNQNLYVMFKFLWDRNKVCTCVWFEIMITFSYANCILIGSFFFESYVYYFVCLKVSAPLDFEIDPWLKNINDEILKTSSSWVNIKDSGMWSAFWLCLYVPFKI